MFFESWNFLSQSIGRSTSDHPMLSIIYNSFCVYFGFSLIIELIADMTTFVKALPFKYFSTASQLLILIASLNLSKTLLRSYIISYSSYNANASMISCLQASASSVGSKTFIWPEYCLAHIRISVSFALTEATILSLPISLKSTFALK